METESILSTAVRDGACIFVVDPACGSCSRGETEFRKKTGQEFVRHVIAGIERLLAVAGEQSFVECALYMIGFSETLTFSVPGARMLAAFSRCLGEAVDICVAGASRADAFVISDAVSFVCKQLRHRKVTQRAELYLFALAPAATPEGRTFVRGSEADPGGGNLRKTEPCSAFEQARVDMLASSSSLVWIDSSTRREVAGSKFNARAYLAFEKWLISTKFAKAVLYLHTLICDRSILPFAAVIDSYRAFPENVAADIVADSFIPLPGRLVSDRDSLNIEYCFPLITQASIPALATDPVLLHCRALFPSSQSSESGVLGSPCRSRRGVCVRPSSSNCPSSSDCPGEFAGLMIGLAETGCVLIVDVPGIGTAFLRPLAPLLGSLVWMDSDLNVLDDALRTRARSHNSTKLFGVGARRCVGRFSASVFESFVGAGLVGNEAVEETTLQVVTGMSSSSHTSTQLPSCCVADALSTIVGARSEPVGLDLVFEIKQLKSPGQINLATPSRESSPSIADREQQRLQLLESIVMPRFNEGFDSVKPAGSQAGPCDLPLKDPPDILPLPRTSVDTSLHNALLSSKYSERNNIRSTKRRKLDPDGGDTNEETFESILMAISHAIVLLETESGEIVTATCGPADEIASIFAMLRALWPSLNSLTGNEWEKILPMRQSSKKIRQSIASTRSALLLSAGSESEDIRLRRACLGKFARAYFECVLGMCSLACGNGILLTREKACRPMSKILACVRAESSRLDECLPGSLMLNAAFDSFFAKCLNLRTVPKSLNAVVVELCSQNDKLYLCVGNPLSSNGSCLFPPGVAAQRVEEDRILGRAMGDEALV